MSLFRKHTVDFEFQVLLKRHFTRVKYFDATVMDPVDLDRVKVIDSLSNLWNFYSKNIS